jgi:hypothetical protein
MLILNGCTNEDKFINEKLNDENSKLNKSLQFPIRAEYNPIPLSKNCNKNETIKFRVPKPNLFKQLGQTYTDSIKHNIIVYINNIKAEEFIINNNFYEIKKGKKQHKNYKWIEIPKSIFVEMKIDSGIVKLEMISNNELIDSYKCRFLFLDDEEIIEVFKTSDYSFSSEFELYNNYNFKFSETGEYIDNFKSKFKVQKLKDQYSVTSELEGNTIFKLENYNTDSEKRIFHTKVPNIQKIISYIPLGFELVEKELEFPSVIYQVTEKNLGKRIGYNILKYPVGEKQSIIFSNCVMETKNSEMFYYSQIESWSFEK